MTLNAAYNILEKETEFLGADWDRLMYLLRTNPMMFPHRVLNAYARAMKDKVIILEEDV
jgi:hypothetical protein